MKINNGPLTAPGLVNRVSDLTLNGKHHKIDCYLSRDRLWGQVRIEDEVTFPPIGLLTNVLWKGLLFQLGQPENKPGWEGVFQYDHFSWLVRGGAEVRGMCSCAP